MGPKTSMPPLDDFRPVRAAVPNAVSGFPERDGACVPMNRIVSDSLRERTVGSLRGRSMLLTKRLGCCLALSAAVLAGGVSAQGPRSNSKTITWQSPQNSKDIQVGILGEIAAPGAYHLEAGALTVQALVRRAGGLTEDASLSIRIVRQERVAQSLFFSPQADSRLMPGDVLIVESKRSWTAMSKVLDGGPRDNPVRQAGNNSPDPTGVQVAYINVLDTPVIVKLHLDDARLDRVVQMLGQPIELAGAVKVIDPERAANIVAQVASGTLRLTDGTVLIFPKGAINRGKLPSFPKPYDSEIAAGALPSMIGGVLGQAPELRSVGQMAPLMTLPSHDSIPVMNSATIPVIAPPSAIPIAPATPQFEPQPAPMPVVSSRPRIATLPFTGAAPLRSSSSRGPLEQESIAPPPQDDPQPQSIAASNSSRGESARTASKSNAKLQELASDSDLSATTEPAGSSPFTVFQMFGILAGVSTLIGLALIARKHFDKQMTGGHWANRRRDLSNSLQTPTKSEVSTVSPNSTEFTPHTHTPLQMALASTESPPESSLDRLIRNELPLREEPAVFPEPILLQGRIAPRPILRLDRAAESFSGAGPHFQQQTNTSEYPSQESSAMELDVHSSNETRISGPHFGRRRNTARPITIGDANRAAAAAPHEAAPSTPLADALRHLQGDRPS